MTRLPRYSLYLRLLRLSLLAGALYDLLLAAVLVFAADTVARGLGVPLPGEAFYLSLMAVFLVMMSAFYLLAVYDPTSYRGNILVAIGGRAAAVVVLATAALGNADLTGLYVMAAGDLFFAVLHATLYWPIRQRHKGG
jgi:hypothetical protein